jgi:ATP-dependent Zn protease
MKVTEQYPRGTAYHEAGHAVVAWALGLPVRTIRVRIDDAGGGIEIGPADHLSLIEQVAVCSAGSAAEEVFECSAHELASFNDHVKVLKLIEANGVSEEEHGPALRDDGYNCARAYLETHKSKVVKLAERLVERGSVDAAEFLRLMNDEET